MNLYHTFSRARQSSLRECDQITDHEVVEESSGGFDGVKIRGRAEYKARQFCNSIGDFEEVSVKVEPTVEGDSEVYTQELIW